MPFLARLKRALPKFKPATPAGEPDGFGQSLIDDAKFVLRFRACRSRDVVWRTPTDSEQAHWAGHPIAGRFGDDTLAVCEIDGRSWVVRERLFHGWPDPPRFAFFALEDDGRVWCARDFTQWPPRWTGP